MHKNYQKLLLLLSVLFILIRLPYLDQISLLHDERDITLTGWAIAKTGGDLYGNFMPLHFEGINPHNPLTSIYFSALSWFFIPLKSIYLARLPYVLISALLIPLAYGIIMQITKRRNLSLLTSVIFCFNPWLFHVTRLSMDVTLATVTLLAAVFFLLKNKRLSAYICAILTVYNYQGFRVLIIPLLLYLEIIMMILKPQKRNTGIYKTVFFLIMLFASIMFMDARTTQARMSQVLFINMAKFAPEVIGKRNSSIMGNKQIRALFDNKFTVSVGYAVDVFLKGQNMDYLFSRGDFSPTNGNVSAGQFLFPFFIFYYLGLFALGFFNKKPYFLVLGFIPVGLLPAMASLNGISFGIRGIFSGLGYAFIISCGLLYGHYMLKKSAPVLKRTATFTVIVLFFISINYFVYNYFFRRPVIAGEMFSQNELNLASYLVKKQGSTVYHNNPKEAYLTLAMIDNTNSIRKYVSNLSKNLYTIDGIRIVQCKKNISPAENGTAIIHEACLTEQEYQKYIKNNSIKKIMYSDISERAAYFIFE